MVWCRGVLVGADEWCVEETSSIAPCVVVVVALLRVFGLEGGTVVVVVVVVVAPGVVALITCCAWAIAACIASMSVWNCARLPALSAACALV